MWFNNNELNNWESDHSTYFGLHFILFEHLELLEHRATLTAGETMLFCVAYSRKISSFLVVSAYLAFFLLVNHRKCVTQLLNGSLQFYCVLFVSCLDILVLKVFSIKPTFCEHSLREDGE